MKKKLTRLFSVLLAAVLVLGTLPVSAMGTDVADPPASAVDDTPAEVSAAEPEEASVVDETPDGEEAQSGEVEAATVESTVAAKGYEMNIFFLDCGRKYYSVDSIKQLIDNASAAGFNYIQLAVGNDGMRLLLDDMSLTVDGTEYKSEDVKAAIHAGNEKYPSQNEKASGYDNASELTETEMNQIILYAQGKGMGVIPCVNTPGHMYALLTAINTLTNGSHGYTSTTNGNLSKSTINLEDETAVAFTKAILQKYIAYFSKMGCKFFNMGADEYANDTKVMGFYELWNNGWNGKMGEFITYVNQIATLVKEAGMKPMAFNDGVYYHSSDIYGVIDKDVIVCYWSQGWISYDLAKASFLNEKGYKLVNTNGAYYWVLGADQCDADTASDFGYDGFATTAAGGVESVKGTLGSMFCIWSDYPYVMEEATVVSKSAATIQAFGGACPTVNSVTETPIKSGNVTITVGSNNGDDASGNNTLTIGAAISMHASKEVDWTASNDNVVITLTDENVAPNGANTAVRAATVNVEAVKAGDVTITATDPSDSTNKASVTLNIAEKAANTKTIEYWITNRKVTGSDNNTEKKLTTESAAANGEDGVDISKLVPTDGKYNENVMAFWKATRLKSNNKQTEKGGVDKTLAGNDFTKIRYYNEKWSFWDGTKWEDFNDDDQIVAYYMQVTDVTDEVTTEVVDWGPLRKAYTDNRYVLLDFAVKYESSNTRVPNAFPNGKTVAFHCDSSDATSVHKDDTTNVYYRTIGRINAVETANYEVYMITLTPNTDNASSYLTSYDWQSNTAVQDGAIAYSGTEKVVWVDDEKNLGDFADKEKAAGYSVGGEPSVPSLNIYFRHAMLVTYYLRAKPTDTSLNVKYVDETTNEEFYSYIINAKGAETVFDEKIDLNQSEWKGDLVHATITNVENKNETVSADLSTMSAVPVKYRRAANYTCTRVVRSDEGKTVTLYYTFNNHSAFVVDFGTPLTITKDQVSENLKGAEITGVVFKNVTCGTASDDGNGTITYTPGKDFAKSKDGDTFDVVYTGTYEVEENGETKKQTGSVAYSITVYPASNVLYEENFLTTEEKRWSNTYFVDHTTAQQTQKVGDTETTYNVFGYDPNASAVGANGYWQMENLDKKNDLGKPLTTTFYGNAFDLIGDCGEDTGRVLIAIVNKDDPSQRVKMIDVDTRYNAGTLHQVPLAHAVMTGDAHYLVEIYATKLPESTTTVNTPRGVASYAYDASAEEDEFLNQVLDAYGLTMDDVDYISTATADTLDADSNGAAVYSSTRTATSTITHKEGTHVEIDGFRVYRSTADDVAKNYPESEQNVEYKRILDVVGDVVTAYTEGGTVTNCAVEEYEAKGGPQNEIYLKQDQSVVIQVSDVTPIQVSLRAVSGETSWSTNRDNASKTINSNTEMYYTITPADDGTVTIMNKGENFLALGNVKVKKNTTIVSAENMDPEDILESVRAAYGSSSEEPEVFTPETFTAKTTVTPVVRNKMVTLKVNVSSDVAYITVNGVKYTRTGLQGLFQKTRTIRVMNTVKKGQTKTYEVVAYNADGVASETITVTG